MLLAPLSVIIRPGAAPEVEVDVDASWPSHGDRVSGGIGVVLHRGGDVVASLGLPRRGQSPNILERWALFAGIGEVAARFPGASVRFWTDSQGMVVGLGGASFLFGEVYRASGRLAAVIVEWVPRRCLAEANVLARAAARGSRPPAPRRVLQGVAERLAGRQGRAT